MTTAKRERAANGVISFIFISPLTGSLCQQPHGPQRGADGTAGKTGDVAGADAIGVSPHGDDGQRHGGDGRVLPTYAADADGDAARTASLYAFRPFKIGLGPSKVAIGSTKPVPAVLGGDKGNGNDVGGRMTRMTLITFFTFFITTTLMILLTGFTMQLGT